MFDRWLHIPAHRHLHWIGLALIAIGLPLNPVVTSVGSIWVPANWILEGDFRNKWERGKRSWLMWVAVSLFLLHIVGMLWSSDLAFAANDIRIKLPLLALPIVLATREPLRESEFRFILKAFVLSVLVVSLINYLNFLLTTTPITDVRDMAVFKEHNRFSLMVVLSVFICLYFFLKNELPRWLLSALIIWLSFYTVVSGVVSGFLFLVILMGYTALHVIVALKNKTMKWAALGFTTASIALVVGMIGYQVHNYFDADGKSSSVMAKTTSRGNRYYHNPESQDVENGHYIWRNIQAKEIREEWAKRSNKPLDASTIGCILRYLTSKGLPKDGDALASLSDQEVRNIENGTASVVYNKAGFKARLHRILYEWQDWHYNQKVNGHSLTMRLEFFTIGSLIAENNLWTGVGTGDAQLAFDSMYKDFGTQLSEDNQLRAHNQFLTMFITLGLLGGLLFIGFVILPLVKRRKNLEYLHITFTLLLILACLVEDTLETQKGATFVAFFWAILAFKAPTISGLPVPGLLAPDEQEPLPVSGTLDDPA